ncbi:rac GTPase-activating protein 1 [Sigmodon hispidus]
MDATMVNLWTVFEQLVRRLEIINEGNESIEFIQVVKDFEDFRKKCQRTNQELEKFKDLLLKAETGRSALDVKLKHARNQVGVKIKRR